MTAARDRLVTAGNRCDDTLDTRREVAATQREFQMFVRRRTISISAPCTVAGKLADLLCQPREGESLEVLVIVIKDGAIQVIYSAQKLFEADFVGQEVLRAVRHVFTVLSPTRFDPSIAPFQPALLVPLLIEP